MTPNTISTTPVNPLNERSVDDAPIGCCFTPLEHRIAAWTTAPQRGGVCRDGAFPDGAKPLKSNP